MRSLVEIGSLFGKNNFDLGNFIEIKHAIDTGTAFPKKQRMRRTSLDFVHEEESHLQMLNL